MLKETANDDAPLYSKIGCQHRGTYTSTKLQLIVYTDTQCSNEYSPEDETETARKNDGYDIDGYFLSNKVRYICRDLCVLGRGIIFVGRGAAMHSYW